ncbi:MAG: hypothetical protein S4CHLAM37_01070 [Chlamydiia bacterium]|nr:hypothetical protein [Chlamydiia bacterium]
MKNLFTRLRTALLVSCMIFFLHVEGVAQEKHTLYVFYTPLYVSLYQEYFLPSIKDDFVIDSREFPQICASGKYGDRGWNQTMLFKLDLLEEAIQKHWGGVFFYSDCDVIFFRPIIDECLKQLGDLDLVAQREWPYSSLCAGFIVMRGNAKTLALIRKAKYFLTKYDMDDQQAIARTLRREFIKDLKWKLLPSSLFPSGMRGLQKSRDTEKRSVFEIGCEVEIDSSILMFHANWCKGPAKKHAFLDRVIERYEQKQKMPTLQMPN